LLLVDVDLEEMDHIKAAAEVIRLSFILRLGNVIVDLTSNFN